MTFKVKEGIRVNGQSFVDVNRDIQGNTLSLGVETGTAPLDITSTTLVNNLNSDLLDGYQSAEANTVSTVVVRDASGDINLSNAILHGSTSGTTILAPAAEATGTLTLPAATDTLVGKQTTDTLLNKSIDLTDNTITGTVAEFNSALSDDDFATLTGTETLTNKSIDLTDNTLTGTTAEFNSALSDDDFATLTGTETLTNKSIDLTDNTLTGTVAEFNSALSDDDFATLTGTETLTNKSIDLTDNTLTGTTAEFNSALSDDSFATLAGTETLTNKSIDLTNNTLTGTTAEFNSALSDDSFATLAGSETLTNKSVNLANNTLTGTTAEFNSALSDDDFATLAGTETLTNKTLSSPTFSGISQTFELTGDITGSVTVANIGNVSIATTVAENSVALGTDTTGNYVATIAGTANQITVTGSGSETAAVTLATPQDIHTGASPTFAGATLDAIQVGITGTNEIDTTEGNLTIDSAGGTVTIDDNLIISGDFTVNGTSVTVNSTTISIEDPIFNLGGDEAPTNDDGKDRGVQFRWHDGSNAKLGFFGFDDSSGKFTFIPDATNTNEVFSGTKGTLDANLDWTDILNKPDPTLTIDGDASGTATFTDVGNATLTLTIADDSHNHVVGNIDNFTENVQDIVGAMVSTNTESGVSVTYDDDNGKLNFNVDDFTLTLDGDATGSATITDLANATLTVTIADDSHNHIIDNVDGLQTALDGKVNDTGDTMTGALVIDGSPFTEKISLKGTSTSTIAFYNVDNDVMRIGYSGLGFGEIKVFDNAEDPTGNTTLRLRTGTLANAAKISVDNGTSEYSVFHDGYHPNADKWTLARTLTLTGAVTGSVSIDGSGDVSMATTATADPTLTLDGDVSGSATFTDLGDATLTVSIASASFNVADNYAFKTVSAGGTNLVAESNTDTLTITAAQVDTTDGIVIAGDAGNDSFTIAHADTSSVSDVDNSGNTFVQDLTFDTYGHVTGVTSGTVSIGDATITITAGTDLSTGGDFTTNQSSNETITIDHSDITRSDTTSTATPAYGGTFTVVDSITSNARGHITAVNVKTVTIPASDNTDTDRYVNSASFNTGDGVLTLTRAGSDTATVTVDLDGRYLTSYSETDTLDTVADRGSSTNQSITVGGITLPSITKNGTNGTGNIGQSDNKFNTVYASVFDGTATTAKYADLAENYLADAEYEPGTVVKLGGSAEITAAFLEGDVKAIGVITTNPAHLMNAGLEGEHVASIALRGRVPCKIVGKVEAGDFVIASGHLGYATAAPDQQNVNPLAVIGRAISSKDDDGFGVIEILV